MTFDTSAASILSMKEKSLQQYVEKYGQTETAKRLSVTQGAVWQMLKSNRIIKVVEHKNGRIEAYERKPIAKRKTAA